MAPPRNLEAFVVTPPGSLCWDLGTCCSQSQLGGLEARSEPKSATLPYSTAPGSVRAGLKSFKVFL